MVRPQVCNRRAGGGNVPGMAPRTLQFFLFLHVVGFVFWVGPLVAAARLLLLSAHEAEASAAARIGTLARKIAMVADIGAMLALIGGLTILIDQRVVLLKQPFMHVKLTLVVVLLGLHGLVRVKTKRAAQGPTSFSPAILAALALCVIGIVFAIIFKLPARSS